MRLSTLYKSTTRAHLIVLITIVSAGSALGQAFFFNGPQTVYVGDVIHYQYNGNEGNNGSWGGFIGYAVNQGNGDDDITLLFTASGSFNLTHHNDLDETKQIPITVLGSIPAPPPPSIISSQCGQVIIQMNGSPPANIEWYWQTTSNGQSTELGTYYQRTVTSNGTYYLQSRLTSSGYWGNSSTGLSVTLPTVLPVSVSINDPGPFCATTTNIQFTAVPVNGGGNPTYEWYRNGNPATDNQIAGNTNTYNPYYQLQNGDQVQCKLTSNASCVSGNPAWSNLVTIQTQQPTIPSVSIGVGNQTICEESTVTFSASSPQTITSYSWSLGASVQLGSGSTFSPSGEFALHAPGENVNLTVGVTGFCLTTNSASTSLFETVYPPSQAGTLGGSIPSFCYTGTNGSVNLSLSSHVGDLAWKYRYKDGPSGSWGSWSTYSFSSSNSTSYSNLTSGAEIERYYEFQVTATSGTCTGVLSNVATVVVKPPPTTSNAGSDQTICVTGNASLLANAPAVGTGAWSVFSGPNLSIGQFNNTADRTATFTPVGGPGNYVLRWTISNAPCTDSHNNVLITVNGNPSTANAGPDRTDATTCGLISLNLSATTPAIGSGNWSIITGTGGSITTPGSINSSFSGQPGSSYALRWTVTNAPCTQSTDDVLITFNVNPTVSGGLDKVICGPTPTTIGGSPTASGGATPYSYGWSPSTGLNNTGAANPTFTGSSSNNYTVIVTTVVGCTGTDQMAVTVNSVPSSPIVVFNSTACAGSTLTPPNISNPVGGSTYSWYSDSALTIFLTNGVAPTNAQLGFNTGTVTSKTVYVKETSTANCPGTYTAVSLNVFANPVANAGPDVSIWGGGGSPIGGTPTGSGGTPPYSYSWSPVNFLSDPLVSNPTFTGSTSAGYTVLVTDSHGCQNSDGVSITLETPPVITAATDKVVMGEPVVLDGGAGYDTYDWRNSLSQPVGTGTRTFTTNIIGAYTVTVTKSGVPGSGTSTSFTVKSQFSDVNMNYILSNSIQTAGITDENSIDGLNINQNSQSIQYFDGLGRPIQSVTTQGSPAKNDIVQPIVYDQFGRETTKYLPYVSSSSTGWHVANPLPAQAQFYQTTLKVASDTVPYAVTMFEPSPLNRVIEQGAPGDAWQPDGSDSYTSTDRTVKKAYEFNGANEVLQWTYTVPDATHPFGQISAGPPGALNYYGANQLYKNKTKDEEHHEVIEYIGKHGRTVLKRVQATGSQIINDTNYASTYYIYDDFGNLVVVLPPEGVKALTNN